MAIAAFDPQRSRYVTQVTAGVPVRVVPVASFDPATVDLGDRLEVADPSRLIVWTAWGTKTVPATGVSDVAL